MQFAWIKIPRSHTVNIEIQLDGLFQIDRIQLKWDIISMFSWTFRLFNLFDQLACELVFSLDFKRSSVRSWTHQKWTHRIFVRYFIFISRMCVCVCKKKRDAREYKFVKKLICVWFIQICKWWSWWWVAELRIQHCLLCSYATQCAEHREYHQIKSNEITEH